MPHRPLLTLQGTYHLEQHLILEFQRLTEQKPITRKQHLLLKVLGLTIQETLEILKANLTRKQLLEHNIFWKGPKATPARTHQS